MLEDLIGRSREMDSLKYDWVSRTANLQFKQTGGLIVPNLPELDGAAWIPIAAMPRELAHRQIFAKLGSTVFGKGSSKGLPYDYMMAMPTDLRADVLNRHLKDSGGRQWMLRGYDQDLRAVVDSGFPGGADENGDYEITQDLLMLQDFLSAEPDKYPDFKTIRPYVTDSDMDLKCVWKDVRPKQGAGGTYGLGICLRESETGYGSGGVLPFVQRTSCSNSIVYNHADAFKFTHHKGHSRAGLRVQLKVAIGEALAVAAKVLNRVIEAEEIKVPDFDKVLDGLALQYGWAQPIRTAVTLGTENEQTIAGIVNGITYAAHTAFEDAPAQLEMEMLGGKLLFADPALFEQSAMYARRVEAGLASVSRMPALRKDGGALLN